MAPSGDSDEGMDGVAKTLSDTNAVARSYVAKVRSIL